MDTNNRVVKAWKGRVWGRGGQWERKQTEETFKIKNNSLSLSLTGKYKFKWSYLEFYYSICG